MIRAYPGGWDAMAAAVGMTTASLHNRIYEVNGQSLLVETALLMQEFSKTTLFSEALAREAGGVFLMLPEHHEGDKGELLDKFNEVYAEVGDLSLKFREFTKDGVIDDKERYKFEVVGQHVHRSVEELMTLVFKVFCRPGKTLKDAVAD